MNGRTPRWVKIFGLVLVLVGVAFGITHATGNGLGSHAHHFRGRASSGEPGGAPAP
jgi:hypothetical protein